MVRKINYRKMHMISQDMYEKLKKCLNEDVSKSNIVKETSSPEISSVMPPNETFYQSEYKDPKPGPSNINPETGEYYVMPDVTPAEFKYEDIPEPSFVEQDRENIPSSSYFESFITPEGQYIPPKKGSKTNDPTKIKRSTQFKPNIHAKHAGSVQAIRRDFYVRRPRLGIIPESPMEMEEDVTQSIQQSEQPIRQELPDFSFSDDHRPMRTSTPLPYEFAKTSGVKTRRQKKKFIPLQSCKPKVIYSDGEQQITDIPNINKLKCDICNKFFASKYTLKNHKAKFHTLMTKEDFPVEAMETFQDSPSSSNPQLELEQDPTSEQTTVEQPAIDYESNTPKSLQYQPKEKSFTKWTGKRTSTDAKLRINQPKKLIRTGKPVKKKRFGSWNL
jgi:hypothetical protein